jgi:hypothetical protein
MNILALLIQSPSRTQVDHPRSAPWEAVACCCSVCRMKAVAVFAETALKSQSQCRSNFTPHSFILVVILHGYQQQIKT